MTQLIINGFELPETSHDKYKCYLGESGQTLRMLAGNLTKEVQGNYRIIEYAYDYMGNERLAQFLKIIRGKNTLSVFYLPDDGDGSTLESGQFICTELPEPTFAWSKSGVGLFHNVSFTLEGVDLIA